MTIPRLQMKNPHYHSADSRLVHRSHISWNEYVRTAYENFTPSFAANEGLDAIINYMSPSRRKLKVSMITAHTCCIESQEGLRLYLMELDEDNLILSLMTVDADMNLAFYDATDTARFIGKLFSSYRKLSKRN